MFRTQARNSRTKTARLNPSDINECTERLSNCITDAVCNNTKGAYNCSCKPGYSGDGQTCEGEFVRAQKTLQDIHDDQPKNISEGL